MLPELALVESLYTEQTDKEWFIDVRPIHVRTRLHLSTRVSHEHLGRQISRELRDMLRDCAA
jgi:hypothetical protein